MVLESNQMQRQIMYETAYHLLNAMLSEGLITQSEYESEVSTIETEINPIIMHIPLLYKE